MDMDWTVTMTMTGIVLILDESGIYEIDSICCSICIYLFIYMQLICNQFFYKCQWQWHCHVGTGKCSFVKPANANGWGLESLCVAVGPGALNTQSRVIWNPSSRHPLHIPLSSPKHYNIPQSTLGAVNTHSTVIWNPPHPLPQAKILL